MQAQVQVIPSASTGRRLALLFLACGIHLLCLRSRLTPDVINVETRAASVNLASRVQAIMCWVIDCES